jgi:hypothetical protein
MTTTNTTTSFATIDSAKFIIGAGIAGATAILNTVNVTAEKLSRDTKFGNELQTSINTHGVVAGGISTGKELSYKMIDSLSEALAAGKEKKTPSIDEL